MEDKKPLLNKIKSVIQKIITSNDYTINDINTISFKVNEIYTDIDDITIISKIKEYFNSLNSIRLVETHYVKKTDTKFKEIDDMMFLSKNLYNRALYLQKQYYKNTNNRTNLFNDNIPNIEYDFFLSYNLFTNNYGYQKICKECGEYLNYNFLDKFLKNELDYKALPSAVAQKVLETLDKNWKSYFASLKDYKNNKEKYKGVPKPPKYLDKNGRNIITFALNAISKKLLLNGKIKLTNLNFNIPFINHKKNNKVNLVRIIPVNKDSVKIEIVYTTQKNNNLNLINNSYAGIDLGIVNNATLSFLIPDNNNFKYIEPIIIKSDLISINQYYNKKLALYKSELPKDVKSSNKIRTLTVKRNNKIKNEMHNISALITKKLIDNKIKTLVIGYSEGWKQKVNIGKVNNQNFVTIPFLQLINQLKYKCELIGIKVIPNEESYTSKASLLDLDTIPKYDKDNKQKYTFSGKRTHRGLYKSNNGKLINADVQGSYNQIRKVAPTIINNQGMLEGVAINPIVITIRKIKPVSHVRVNSNENIIQNNDVINSISDS